MKLLMIDNYDSFTYNLVQYLMELGADLTVLRNDEVTPDNVVSEIKPDAIVISPGPGRPENAGNCLDVIRICHTRFPILGVCLGHQAMAQAFGAKITYAPTLMHGKTSEIIHKGQRLFNNIEKKFIATRYHSLVIDGSTLPSRFRISAQTKDGVIMAIVDQRCALYGIQFHPESIMTPEGKTLLTNFLQIARDYNSSKN